MKHRRNERGLTLIEVLLVIIVIAFLASMIPVSFSSARPKAQRIACVGNLKNIGVGYRVWEDDNGNKVPSQVPNSNTNGGWADFLLLTNPGVYCWSNYSVIRKHLAESPRILSCPADDRIPSDHWDQVRNENISYFFGVDASEAFPQSLLGGDRNLGPGLEPKNDFGFSPKNQMGNDVTLQTNSPVCWSRRLHSSAQSIGAGNILFGDGSVQQSSSARLCTDYLPNAGIGPLSNSFRLIFP
jgi:prepilin-type N-terminal cleavage/methylation domain-containing protein/prepilin-type processing-associated H-X9-DG protein